MFVLSLVQGGWRDCQQVSWRGSRAPDFGATDFWLICIPFGHDDEPEIPHYGISRLCHQSQAA